MAKIKETLDLLYELEFNSKDDVLHINKYENGFTFYGIYQIANPTFSIWDRIQKTYDSLGHNIKRTSRELADDTNLKYQVEFFYQVNYWNEAKLDKVKSQKIADEIFVFGVNVGMKTAIIKAQKLIGVNADGIVGNQTLRALNKFNEDNFDLEFDEVEKDYYDAIIKNKPYLAVNKRGWYNRAVAV